MAGSREREPIMNLMDLDKHITASQLASRIVNDVHNVNRVLFQQVRSLIPSSSIDLIAYRGILIENQYQINKISFEAMMALTDPSDIYYQAMREEI
jgi:hypothetical protein